MNNQFKNKTIILVILFIGIFINTTYSQQLDVNKARYTATNKGKRATRNDAQYYGR